MPCQRSSSEDPGKDEANQRKHGVSFGEACERFDSGTDFLDMIDEAHSDREQRFIAVGPIPEGPALALLRIAARHPKIIRESAAAA